jgi:glycosyltransferase involved in cell wall biosynthesis
LSEQQPNKSDVELSVVVPLYNEEQSVAELARKVDEALANDYNYELIFVDDGSTDGSWKEIRKACRDSASVRGVRLQRNYGKSSALQAGFEEARGQFIATMDADLQDDPFEIPPMLQQLKERQLDLVSGWKKKRHDPITKTSPSR